VDIADNGLGTLEENEVTGNALAGVTIRTGANPILRRNRISNNLGGGVLVLHFGRGTIEDNDMRGNSGTALVVDTSSADGVITARNRE
jgi:F-box protein 11